MKSVLRSTIRLMNQAATLSPRRCVAVRASSDDDDWASKDKARRLLNASVVVKDVELAANYYTRNFGMTVVRKTVLEDKSTNVYLAYGPEHSNFALHIVQHAGAAETDMGDGFGHFGLVFDDVYKAADKVKKLGGKITREAGPVKGGSTVIAFAQDPDDFKWEFIQRGATPEPLCQVMLRVGSLSMSTMFYQELLGMKLLRTRENPEYKYNLAFVGYGPEETNAVIELTKNYGVDSYKRGNRYTGITVATSDVERTAADLQARWKLVQPPSVLPGTEIRYCSTVDPDGWPVYFVSEADFLREAAKSDPLDAFCKADPSAEECKVFE